MVIDPVKIEYPGLLKEKLPSGAFRYRVRVEGQKARRIRLHVTPEHPNFREHYFAARAGVSLEPEISDEDATIRNSIGWIVLKYQTAMAEMVANKALDPSTLHYRTRFTNILREAFGEYHMNIPTGKLIEIRDSLAAAPSSADTFIKSIKAMYTWGMERGYCEMNPANGIRRISGKAIGAIPWSIDDLKKYRETHEPGTTAHLALTLFMFTAGRIGDVYRFGRHNEISKNGMIWLKWQPEKKGSTEVFIPMMPPLQKATRSIGVVGRYYLLNDFGQPFASKKSFGNRFSKWCKQAGLENRSSHGIRKAAGYLLAHEGASQYHIMAIHGHVEAKTSEVYTKGVEREHMAEEAMRLLENMDW